MTMTESDKKILKTLYYEKMYNITEIQAYFKNKYTYQEIKFTIFNFLKGK